MRGPSSSHTAASQRIGIIARQLLGAEPKSAAFMFDRGGSYGQVFRRQGSDLAFAAGLMGWEVTDERFFDALDIAARDGLSIDFSVGDLEDADHPNSVEIDLTGEDGGALTVLAKSVGGGMIEFTRVDGLPVSIDGETYAVLVESEPGQGGQARAAIESSAGELVALESEQEGGRTLLVARMLATPEGEFLSEMRSLPGVRGLRVAEPVLLPRRGEGLFGSGSAMISVAGERGLTLGELAIEYEAELLGMEPEAVAAEFERRLNVMRESVRLGLEEQSGAAPLQLLEPSAPEVYRSILQGQVALGGPHARAAARAMAAMHVNGGMGVVCAAPTGGSAGAIPGALVTLIDDLNLARDVVVRALAAAGAVGLIILARGTFAAEEAGCQVEIGAAGAMAAAAVVDTTGGTPAQAADAAAISLQNTIGMPCDLVQGAVEIPCHTRNAAAASSAFVCADLIMGGYENPIPLDETIDASIAVGKSLHPDLRCTARGGLAAAPSAKKARGG